MPGLMLQKNENDDATSAVFLQSFFKINYHLFFINELHADNKLN